MIQHVRKTPARHSITSGRTAGRGAVVAMAAAALTLVLVLAGCSGGPDTGDADAPFAPGGTTTGDAGGSVEVNVEVGQCVTLGGSADAASARPAECGSADATHKVVGKAPKSEDCVGDVDAAYYESVMGVAEVGALCLDVDWVRPRSVLSPATVERALEQGGRAALRTLVQTEVALAQERQGEATGLHMVASARRP